MRMRKTFLLLFTHAAALAVGFGLGIYALPLLIAPAAPTPVELAQALQAPAAASDAGASPASVRYTARFVRDLADSDALHWGEGEVTVTARHVALQGRLAPGPDYKLYFSPTFVETEADFERLKPQMRRAGDVKTFDNFLVELPADLDVQRYTTVIVWCETFRQFITAARYR